MHLSKVDQCIWGCVFNLDFPGAGNDDCIILAQVGEGDPSIRVMKGGKQGKKAKIE